jgi:hypothetical protein
MQPPPPLSDLCSDNGLFGYLPRTFLADRRSTLRLTGIAGLKSMLLAGLFLWIREVRITASSVDKFG